MDQPIILFSVMVDFQGKVGPAIRCRVPTAKDNRAAASKADPISSGPAPQRQAAPAVEMFDDEIPF
jgi:hypothetical protein